jgi:hypothetical protein
MDRVVARLFAERAKQENRRPQPQGPVRRGGRPSRASEADRRLRQITPSPQDAAELHEQAQPYAPMAEMARAVTTRQRVAPHATPDGKSMPR